MGAQIRLVLVLDYSVDELEHVDRNTVGFIWITYTESRLCGQGRPTLFRITVYMVQSRTGGHKFSWCSF